MDVFSSLEEFMASPMDGDQTTYFLSKLSSENEFWECDFNGESVLANFDSPVNNFPGMCLIA